MGKILEIDESPSISGNLAEELTEEGNVLYQPGPKSNSRDARTFEAGPDDPRPLCAWGNAEGERLSKN